MSDAYHSDEEQVENLKRWWKENGTSTVTLIAVAFAAVLGWQSWQKHQVAQVDKASNLYQSLLKTAQSPQLTDEQKATTKHVAGQLKSEFKNSNYAHFAAFFQAQLAVKEGDLEDAQQQLQWVLDNSADKSTQLIAKYRLARVLFAKQSYDEAMALLDTDMQGYETVVEELRGDIYHAKGDLKAAQAAYQKAQESDAKRSTPMNSFMLKIKTQKLANELGTL